ncbi:CPBP family intramembrane metalloprotease domain-containing protein [Pseudonocardia sp. TMWB2A]|uniref:CPBP family intramembrane glutamic endopeptidase n=1 Tax=Pseudonocardia sp. TMWB2A TaxID=687430 RepID=UPI00307D9B66
MQIDGPQRALDAGTSPPRDIAARTDTVPAGVEYHRVLAGEKRQLGRGLLAIVLLVGGMWAMFLGFAVLARWLDLTFGIPQSADGRGLLTPTMHACGLLATGLIIPWSMFIQRWLYGVPGASLHSVFSRFRLDLFARALFVIAPAFVVLNVVSNYILPAESTAWVQSDLLWMLAVTLLLMPLQAAGEEYGIRGLIFRVAGSWGRGPRSSLVLGIAVSTVVFASIHLAGNPWLYLWYFILAVSAALITWRTGGIEIAVVIHVAFNTLSFVFAIAMSSDLAGGLDRSVNNAATGISMITPSLVVIATVVAVWFRTRHTGPVTTPVMDSQRAEGSAPQS